VRIGLFLAYWPWFSPEEQISLARQADRAGLDSVWVAEAWGQDVVSVLGHLSAVTERVALGSGLMQIPGRTPAMTAMSAVTLDVLSGGRFRLGLGVSGPQVSEGWHGVPFARPLARTREYVEIVRAALAREGPLEYQGEEFQLPIEGGTGLGKPLKLLARPVQERIPIYLGSMDRRRSSRRRRSRTAGCRRCSVPSSRSRSGGTDVDISPVVMVSVDEDIDRARDLARPWLTVYLGGMGSKEKNFYVEAAERSGQGEAAREVQRRYLAGDRAGAAAALTPELIDSSAVCCRPAELDEHLARYERAGATSLLAMPFGDRSAITDQLASAIQTG
jgi:alkanesulfonate monooxygenase SsuD/methylene tetrahydromethanopterin reductase-like flavin-dependent oxidoreductase (luciferase family)